MELANRHLGVDGSLMAHLKAIQARNNVNPTPTTTSSTTDYAGRGIGGSWLLHRQEAAAKAAALAAQSANAPSKMEKKLALQEVSATMAAPEIRIYTPTSTLVRTPGYIMPVLGGIPGGAGSIGGGGSASASETQSGGETKSTAKQPFVKTTIGKISIAAGIVAILGISYKFFK